VQVAQASDNSLSVTVEYSTELFDRVRVERLVGHFGVVLAAVVAVGGVGRRVDGVEVVSGGERELVVGRFAVGGGLPGAGSAGAGSAAAGSAGGGGGLAGGGSGGGWPWSGGLVPGVLAGAVGAHAGGCAVGWDGGWLSYAGFGAAVAELAGRLVERGVGRGRVVAVCARRGVAQVVGLHAVLVAGAAFLALDPDQPPARLGFQLADAGAVVVLADPDVELPVPAGVGRIALTGPAAAAGAETAAGTAGTAGAETAAEAAVVGVLAGWAERVRPADPAYLIYTSGSTGRPKAVVNTHAGLANRLAWMQASYPIGPADRVIQKTPATFDVSVWEFLWPLLAGARLVLPAHAGHRDLAYLARFMAEQQVSIAHFVPSVLRAFLDQADLALPRLRHLFCSGEALPAGTRDRALRRWPQARLHNLYGPTEASIDVTAASCALTDGPTVSIGRPISNMRTYLLDPRTGQPSPIGVPGHLHLAGVGLASHYAHRPALTAERFTPNPYGPPGDRLYATGDLAQWRPDGSLHYLGRTDHQIKLNGQRIEPGEIEHTLTRHPAVSHAAVVLTTPADNPPFLTAYLVATPGHTPDDTELRTHLAQHLPLHMIPTSYLHLPHLPLTPNGKLDRTQLPQPTTTHPANPPTTPTQHTLATIWADILNTPTTHITLNHNFFQLGGSSLRTTQLISRIRDAFYVDLDPQLPFTHPELGQLAELVDAAVRAEVGEEDLSEMEAEIAGLSEEELDRLLAESAEDGAE
jgi:amino acid adenylation domain-containing protein